VCSRVGFLLSELSFSRPSRVSPVRVKVLVIRVKVKATRVKVLVIRVEFEANRVEIPAVRVEILIKRVKFLGVLPDTHE